VSLEGLLPLRSFLAISFRSDDLLFSFLAGALASASHRQETTSLPSSDSAQLDLWIGYYRLMLVLDLWIKRERKN
jgi:hypothetical protein